MYTVLWTNYLGTRGRADFRKKTGKYGADSFKKHLKAVSAKNISIRRKK